MAAKPRQNSHSMVTICVAVTPPGVRNETPRLTPDRKVRMAQPQNSVMASAAPRHGSPASQNAAAPMTKGTIAT